jgi:nitrate reductase cytochrome c-type subunit
MVLFKFQTKKQISLLQMLKLHFVPRSKSLFDSVSHTTTSHRYYYALCCFYCHVLQIDTFPSALKRLELEARNYSEPGDM